MNHGKTTMNMQEFINDCIISAVKISQDTYDMKLDFSEESILIVDEVLEGYHERYLHPEEDDGLIHDHANTYAYIFGIYVGEVLLRRRESDYSWLETEYGIVLAKEAGNLINPAAKAMKQIMNGKEGGDDIKSFFDVACRIMDGKFK